MVQGSYRRDIYKKTVERGRLLLQALAELCFPSHCLGCRKALLHSSLLLCPTCLEEIEFITTPFCPCCCRTFPAGENHLCGLCLTKKRYFTRARSIILYNEMAAQIIVALKFAGKRESLNTLQKLKEMSAIYENVVRPDYIIPVPLHKKRLQKRGFNQSLLLARAFYPDAKKRISNELLVRSRETAPQTGLDGARRRKNVKNAFTVMDKRKVKGKNIVLVDDVYTTGTTVNECARVLRRAGARQVDVLTLARVRE